MTQKQSTYKIEHLPIGKVQPNPDNPRFIKDDAFHRLVKALADCPDLFEARPLICSDRTGDLIVLGGNMRLRAAQELKYKDVPVIVMKGLTPDQEREVAVKDNGAFGQWDFEALANAWDDLPLVEWGVDLPEDWLTGQAGDGAGDAPEPQIDRAEELQKEWKTATGQVWEIGKHRVMCGDTSVDLPTLMSGSLGHLIFTDPPYGVGYDGGAKKREKLTGDHIGTDIYTETLPSLASAVDNEAALYLWYADGHAAAAAAAAAGYQIVAQIIWAKNHAQFVTSAHYKGKHEPCYYGHKRGHSARWHGPNNEVTLWEYDRSACNEFHPTQKPVAVALRAVKNSTKPGQIVVDGFLGGGTTLVAAEQTGRICYGMEISPPYVAVCLQRMKDMGLEPKLINERIE